MLTVNDVAERLGCSAKFVYRLVWAHELEHYRIGASVRIPDGALEEYLERCRVPVRRGA